MILKLIQTERLPVRKHVFEDLSCKNAGAGIVPKCFVADIKIFGDALHMEMREHLTMEIQRDGLNVGKINQDIVVTKKILFLKTGFDYFKFSFDEIEYSVFESGLGSNQHYFCLYSGNDTVGIIHKDDFVRNYCDTYTLYTIDKAIMKALCVFAMYLEATFYVDRTAGIGNSEECISHYSAQAELREKYDPTFIPRIKQMDGMIN